MKKIMPSWLLYSSLATLMNGVWGALIEIPEKRMSPSFPTTLGYVVWALTMIPCALYALKKINWKLDYSMRSIVLGTLIGLLGAGGQFVCFLSLKLGPAYIIFPIISLAPVVTIVLSILILKERTQVIAYIGIILSLIAIFFLSIQEADKEAIEGFIWLILAIGAFLMWGLQGFFIKRYIVSMEAETIFFYMTIGSLLLVPIGFLMTDFTQPIGWYTGLSATIIIQFLNALGAILAVYAFRYGKAIIVSPIINGLTPFIAIILSLIIYSRVPYYLNVIGMGLSLIALFMITYGESKNELTNK